MVAAFCGTEGVEVEDWRRGDAQAPMGRVPRIVRMLALAHKIDGMIRAGELRDLADAARAIGVTRARMSDDSVVDDRRRSDQLMPGLPIFRSLLPKRAKFNEFPTSRANVLQLTNS